MPMNSQSLLTIERDMLTSSVASENYLLRHLFNSQSVKDVLLPELKMVTLSTNQVLYEQGDQDRQGLLSTRLRDFRARDHGRMEDGTTIETSMVGREGLVHGRHEENPGRNRYREPLTVVLPRN
jgi:hypothetical protein